MHRTLIGVGLTLLLAVGCGRVTEDNWSETVSDSYCTFQKRCNAAEFFSNFDDVQRFQRIGVEHPGKRCVGIRSGAEVLVREGGHQSKPEQHLGLRATFLPAATAARREW